MYICVESIAFIHVYKITRPIYIISNSKHLIEMNNSPSLSINTEVQHQNTFSHFKLKTR